MRAPYLRRSDRPAAVSGLLIGVLIAIVVLGSQASPAHAQAIGVNLTPPAVMGAPIVGEPLTVTAGTYDPPAVALSYQWTRAGVPIPGAVATSYLVSGADLGAQIAVIETATDAMGVVTQTPAIGLGPVTEPTLLLKKQPRMEGEPRFGRSVAAEPGSVWPGADEVRFRWLRDLGKVSTSRRYRVGAADVGHLLSLEVTYRRDGYAPLTVVSDPVKMRHRVDVRRTFTYSVLTRGPVSASVADFRQQAQQTYDDPRGWRAAGFAFRRVKRGGDFTLVLANAATVPSYSSVCSPAWSCRVGRYVIINQTRWLHASPAWNAAGGSRRDYRHMVVNHETGHWLGHGHAGCSGGRAPVMMQQSKGHGGCTFNPWPLPRERWVRR